MRAVQAQAADLYMPDLMPPTGSEWRDWAHPFVASPFEVKDGMVTVPDRPGNCIEWDEAAVKRLQKA